MWAFRVLGSGVLCVSGLRGVQLGRLQCVELTDYGRVSGSGSSELQALNPISPRPQS